MKNVAIVDRTGSRITLRVSRDVASLFQRDLLNPKIDFVMIRTTDATYTFNKHYLVGTSIEEAK